MSSVITRVTAGDEPRFAFQTDWDGYQAIAKILQASADHVRIAFDGERVELRMSPSPLHERDMRRLRYLVEALADARAVPRLELGATRWDRPEAERGLEADTSFYLGLSKIEAVHDRPKDLALWPLPDLAIEVDHSAPQIDRESIYVALRVPEIWRFDGADLEIDVLNGDAYTTGDISPTFGATAAEVAAWVLDRDARDDREWEQRVDAWAQARFGG
jgi:Uma2 family endonuclease